MLALDILLMGWAAPGVWSCDDLPVDPVEHVRSFGWYPILVQDPDDKPALLRQIAVSGGFPDWVGRNWDALEDALTDLSWLPDIRIAIVVDAAGCAPDDPTAKVLIDILVSVTRRWERAARTVVAVWRGPSSIALPVLRPPTGTSETDLASETADAAERPVAEVGPTDDR
jgi:hypothetical protein